MYSAIIAMLLAWFSADCAAATSHQHDRLKDSEVIIFSWDGCAVIGTISGVSTALFMDVTNCPLHAKVPGSFHIRYDQTCGAILEITDGPVITTPMPPTCPALPACRRNEIIGQPPKCRCLTRAVGNPKRCKG